MAMLAAVPSSLPSHWMFVAVEAPTATLSLSLSHWLHQLLLILFVVAALVAAQWRQYRAACYMVVVMAVVNFIPLTV